MCNINEGRIKLKVLYVHIGMPKTGTSAIQDFCDVNSDKLYENGLIYRFMPFNYRGIANRLNAYFLCGKAYYNNGKINYEEMEKRKQTAYQCIRDWFGEKDKVLLTTEGLWNYCWSISYSPLEEIKKFADENGYVLKIVAYLRRQDDWAASLYRQRIKNGRFYGTLEEWLDSNRMALDYEKHLGTIGEIVGEENIILRRYNRKEFYKGKIELDFLKALGVDTECDYVFNEETVNPSLPMNYLEIERILSALDHGIDKERAHSGYGLEVERYLRRLGPSIERSGNEELLTGEQRQKIMGRYAQSNEHVQKKYFDDGKPLFPDLKLKDNEEVWTSDNPDRYADTVLFFGGLVLEQNKRMQELTAQNEKLSKKIDKLKEQYHREMNPYRKFAANIRKIKHTIVPADQDQRKV